MPPTDKKDSIKYRTGGPASILYSLYYKILLDLGIGTPRFDTLLRKYVERTTKGSSNTKDESSARGNLKKELTNPKGMSWNVFIKGLTILNILGFDIQLTLKHPNKSTTIHNISIQLDYNAELEEEEETKDGRKDKK